MVRHRTRRLVFVIIFMLSHFLNKSLFFFFLFS